MMYLGVDGIFVGSGIFESSNPSEMAEAMCKAVQAGRSAFLAGSLQKSFKVKISF